MFEGFDLEPDWLWFSWNVLWLSLCLICCNFMHYYNLFINPSCSIMYQAGVIPECCCGEGKMELLKAGKYAINAGRWYLRCPTKGNHPMSFMWYDEYYSEKKWHISQEIANEVRESRPTAVRDNSYSNGTCSHCCASNSTTETKVNLLLGLLGLLLVALCILIGKSL